MRWVAEVERMPREHLHNFMSWTWAGFLPVTFCFAPLLLQPTALPGTHCLQYLVPAVPITWCLCLSVISAVSPVQCVKLCILLNSIHSISAEDTNAPNNAGVQGSF